MNEIRIASILTQRRRDKGITQEKLAEYMGVSKAAVSKWEKSQSYPDITLLPQLAAYFNISVDELIGYSPQLTREDSRKLCRRLSADFMAKPFDTVMSECREIIKKYYSCFPLLYQMAVLFISHSANILAEHHDELLQEAKTLCERIVLEGGNSLLVRDALYAQCRCCIMLETPDEVLDLLGESFNTPEITEDSLISQAFQLVGNAAKAKEVSQCGMYHYLSCLIETTLQYVALSADNFDTARTAFERAMALIQLYEVDKLNANTAGRAYLYGANLYCRHGHSDKALELLEKYADLCLGVDLPFKMRGDSFFTDIDKWLDNSELGSTILFAEKMIKENMLSGLTEVMEPFAAIKDEPRYKSIVRRITDNE